MAHPEERQDAIPAWERIGAVAGIAFAVLLVSGVILVDPVSGQSDQKFTEFYAERSNRIAVIAGMYLIALAGACFLWFLGSLRRVLLRAEGAPGTLSTVSFAGGIVFAAMLCAGGAAMGLVAASMSLGGEPQPSPEIGRLFTQLGYTLILLFGMIAGIVLIVGTSVLALRTGVLPLWLSLAGFVAAGLSLLGVIFISAAAFPLWVVAVSIVMLRRGMAVQPIERAVPSPA
jgi:hypothetical protein